MSGLAITFCPREEALVAIGVLALGVVAKNLARRILRENDTKLAQLRAIATDDILVFLGTSSLLPWVDGVVYLGTDPEAPLLLMPTTHRPDLALDAFERAVLRRLEPDRPPIVVLHDPPVFFSAADAQAIQRGRLLAWLEQQP